MRKKREGCWDVDELNNGVAVDPEAHGSVGAAMSRLAGMVEWYGAKGADDLQFLVGTAPRIRIDGRLLTDDDPGAQTGVSAEELLLWAEGVGGPEGRAALETGAAGHVWGAAETSSHRMRVTLRRQEGGYAASVRIIPTEVPTTKVVDAPQQVLELLDRQGGLIIVCGAVANGKSWTLAAFVDYINNHYEKHILTLEDPIELKHLDKKSLVSQRQVGRDTISYGEGMRAAMRSSPDVILLGELLDRETVHEAVDAAGKGHLVMTTAHAASAVDAINFLISQFPGDEQPAARIRIAQSLIAIVVQRLVPKAGGQGRVPAREILLNNRAVAMNIRDGHLQKLGSRMNARERMVTLEDDLAKLATAGVITWATAVEYANDRLAIEDHEANPANKPTDLRSA